MTDMVPAIEMRGRSQMPKSRWWTDNNQPTYYDIKLDTHLRSLAAGVADIFPVPRFGGHALNFVFQVDGRMGERYVYHGDETRFGFVEAARAYALDAKAGLLRRRRNPVASVWRTFFDHNLRSAPLR